MPPNRPYLNIEIYSGIGDTVILSGSMSVGSGNLTVANASFDAAWIGKLAWVVGADLAGTDLLDAIIAVVSPTVVTLGRMASTAVTAAMVYIGSDHSVAINSCISFLTAKGGGILMLAAGMFFLSIFSTTDVFYQNDIGSYAATAIRMKSNVWLCGAGRSTVLFSPKGASHVGTVEDPWQWGNWPAVIGAYNEVDIKVSDLVVSQGCTLAGGETDAWLIYFNGCRGVDVINCKMIGGKEDGARLDQWRYSDRIGPVSSDIRVIDCEVTLCGGQALEFNYTDRILVKGNYLHQNLNYVDASAAECISFGGSGTGIQILGNRSDRWGDGTSWAGTFVDIQLIDNQFRDGVLFIADTATLDNVQIKNNLNVLADSGSFRDQNITLKGLIGCAQIKNNILSTGQAISIQVQSGASTADIMIEGNSSNGSISVPLGSDALKTSVRNNHCSGTDVNTTGAVVSGNI